MALGVQQRFRVANNGNGLSCRVVDCFKISEEPGLEMAYDRVVDRCPKSELTKPNLFCQPLHTLSWPGTVCVNDNKNTVEGSRDVLNIKNLKQIPDFADDPRPGPALEHFQFHRFAQDLWRQDLDKYPY